MANPLRLAHAAAVWATDQLGVLFDRAGNSGHNRGRILQAYRHGLTAAEIALKAGGRAAAMEALRMMRATIQGESLSLLISSMSLGGQVYRRQIEGYEIEPLPVPETSVLPALAAVIATVDRQITTAEAMLISDVDTALVFGDEERQGVLRPSPVIQDLAQWMVELAMLALLGGALQHNQRNPRGPQFNKQVVAALDERTTECCLLAHGQIQPLERKFQLRGTPRYADELDHTPFHGWCRSSIALYLPEFDDGLTQGMLDGARKILAERAAGGSGYRHPADATA